MQWIDSWSKPVQAQTISPDNKKIQWVRIIPFILLHLACLAVFYVGISWFALAFMLMFYLIRMFSITAFFHRYLSHKTFKTYRVVQFIFVL
ncbi:MAG: acyl-CoA desaturase, partial [Acinetobacter sp.]